MKVAYNNCFGGFTISEEALRNIAELKGVSLKGMKYDYSMFYNRETNESFGDLERTDKELIQTIEDIGSKRASGMCSCLAIAEIPDGAEYEIDEYDGNESVLPPRPSW
jgi:hypothetical protein